MGSQHIFISCSGWAQCMDSNCALGCWARKWRDYCWRITACKAVVQWYAIWGPPSYTDPRIWTRYRYMVPLYMDLSYWPSIWQTRLIWVFIYNRQMATTICYDQWLCNWTECYMPCISWSQRRWAGGNSPSFLRSFQSNPSLTTWCQQTYISTF